MSAERVRLLAWARAMATVAAAVGNVTVFALLARAPDVRPGVVVLGAGTNAALLSLDTVLTLAFLRRRGRFYTPIFRFCLLLEVIAGTLWLQLTGTVSSYYIGAGLLLIVLYRLAVDYATALVFTVGTIAGHLGCFLLEQAGVLKPASLFAGAPAGLYAGETFRWAAMFSMSWLYGVAFAAGNFVATLLTEKDEAVAEANQHLRRVVEETREGRLSGTLLSGRYLLGEVIGRGGMGEVYQATRRPDGATVAVKVLHAHLSLERDARERFRREAELVTRLPAGFAPAIHELGATREGHAYIVMDRLVGEDLAAVLRRRGALPPAEVATLVERIAAALDAAHAVGIVHRDLKPQNVIVVDGGAVRLLDFGVARLLERAGSDEVPFTQTAAIIGTAGYLAPEQARASLGEVGPETDVFALGAVIWRALTGRGAFPSRHPAAAIDEALHLHPAPPSALVPGLPTDIDAVVAIALAKRPRERYSRAGELAVDFRAALTGQLEPAKRARAARLPRAATVENRGDTGPGCFEPTAFEPTVVLAEAQVEEANGAQAR